jgi:hypothetical protein
MRGRQSTEKTRNRKKPESTGDKYEREYGKSGRGKTGG